jgi:hypothetical protein
MSDLVSKLRHWKPVDLDALSLRREAAARIEALEAALREIAASEYMPSEKLSGIALDAIDQNAAAST